MKMVVHGTNGLGADVKALLENGRWLAGAQRVKHNVRRSIYRLPPAGDRPGLYVKHDHPVNPRDVLKNLWRRKARQEYDAGLRLAAAGVPVVGMLAWGCNGRDSFLVTRELSGARTLGEYLDEIERAPGARQLFIARFALFLRSLLAAGVRHPDLHVGNVLVAGEVTAPELVLVDVYGVVTGRRSAAGAQRLRAFALTVLGMLNVTALYRFFRRLEPGAALADIDSGCRDAYALLRKEFRRRWRGRRRGFLQQSRVCTVRRDAAGRWLIRDGVDPAAPGRWLATYTTIPPHDAAAWLKRDTKRLLARLADGPGSCVAKEFRRPGAWGRWRSDCRCWVNTQMSELLGFPVMQALAWLKARDGRGILFLQDGGDTNLHRALQGLTDPVRRRLLLSQVAWIFGRLHACGIWHGDCKASNFMVVPAAHITTRLSPWVRRGLETVAMVDADSLRLSAGVSLAQRAENLRSWRASLPAGFAMTRGERARFLVIYSRRSGLTRAERRTFAAPLPA